MQEKPSTCTGCPLQGEGYAPPSGPANSKTLIVGEALGAEEARLGRPFQGGAGRVLNALLRGAALDRQEICVDNCIRCRPPSNKIPKDFDPMECARRHLLPSLKEQKPNIIIALGNTALNTLTGLDKITKQRGSVFQTIHGKVLATLHPAHLMRNQSMWAVVVADLIKAKRESLFPELSFPSTKRIIFPSLSDIQDFITTSGPEVSVDIETSWDMYHSAALICIGFSTAKQTLCIPWLKEGGGLYWPTPQQTQAVQGIQALLEKKTIFQNGFFDIQVLESLGFSVPNYTFDTLLAHHLLYAELPHDLAFITSMHTPYPYHKDESKSDTGALALKDEVFRGYNCQDALTTFVAAQDLKLDLKREGKWDHFHNITMKLPRILLDMQRRGIAVDTNTLREAIVEYTVDVKNLQRKCEEVGVPKGDKALKEYLFETLGLPVLKRSKKTRAPSLDADTFEKLHDYIARQTSTDKLKQAEQAITLIQEKKKKSKILSTYLRGLPIGPDGRVHCRWLQHGTKNQRLSSRDPNLQNVPKGIARRIYVAKPKHLLYMLDYSQIELRLIAYDAEDLDLIRDFEAGIDVHNSVARDLFNIPAGDPVPSHIRKFTKSCEYCWNYGGDITAVLRVYPGVLSFAEAKRAQKNYFTKRPALAQYRKRIEEEVKKTKTVTDPFGLKRIIFGDLKDNIRSAYNNPLQSGAAYVINTACIRLHEAGLTEGLILQVHDALGFELENDINISQIKAIMEKPVTIKNRTVNLPVDVSYGPNWNELKEWTV